MKVPAMAIFCDERGEVAVCEDCATDLYSPYWSARKAAGLHKRGTEHTVRILEASSLFAAKP